MSLEGGNKCSVDVENVQGGHPDWSLGLTATIFIILGILGCVVTFTIGILFDNETIKAKKYRDWVIKCPWIKRFKDWLNRDLPIQETRNGTQTTGDGTQQPLLFGINDQSGNSDQNGHVGNISSAAPAQGIVDVDNDQSGNSAQIHSGTANNESVV